MLGKSFPHPADHPDTSSHTNETHSAKELEHFERIRQSFESVDKQKQESSSQGAAGAQTIGDALESLKLGDQPTDQVIDGPMPITNGDHATPTSNGSNSGKGKGKIGSSIMRNATGFLTGHKGKGKNGSVPSLGKGKNKSITSIRTGDSDSSLEGGPTGSSRGASGSYSGRAYDDVGEEDDDGAVNGDDEYVVRTDHLAQSGGSK